MIQILVGREQMSAAIELDSTTFNTAAFTGPAMAAEAVALHPPPEPETKAAKFGACSNPAGA